MAKLGDELEQHVDESMPYLYEKLGDLIALKNYGCLTVAQCALLMPALLVSETSDDASETAADYIQRAFFDISRGELRPKHPKSLLPYVDYLEMAEAGMYGDNGENMPFPDASWLVSLEEAERWLKSRGGHVDLGGLKADIERIQEPATRSDNDVTPKKNTKSITKGQVIGAFQGLHFNCNQWKSNLSRPTKWLQACMVTPGLQGSRKSATWNPVKIALSLIDKGVPKEKLNSVFGGTLKNWANEWNEAMNYES